MTGVNARLFYKGDTMSNKGIKLEEIFDWDKVKDAIFFSVSQPTEYELKNSWRLTTDKPCRIENGMMVNYKVLIKDDKGKISTGKVSNQMLKLFDIKESDLYKLAQKNTPELVPPYEIDVFGGAAILDRAEYMLCPSVLKKYADMMGGNVFAWTDNTKQLVILKEGFWNGDTTEEKEKNLMDALKWWNLTNGTFEEYTLKDVKPVHYDYDNGIESLDTFKWNLEKKYCVGLYFVTRQDFIVPNKRLREDLKENIDWKYSESTDELEKCFKTIGDATKELEKHHTEIKFDCWMSNLVTRWCLNKKYFNLKDYNSENDTNLSEEQFMEEIVDDHTCFWSWEVPEYEEDIELTEFRLPVLIEGYHEWRDTDGFYKSERDYVGVVYFDNYRDADDFKDDINKFDGDLDDYKESSESARKGLYLCTEYFDSGFENDDNYEIKATIGKESLYAKEYSINEIDEIVERQKKKVEESLKNNRKV